jgi:hypothetical protein
MIASWTGRSLKPSWRPKRVPVVHWLRAGQGWQVLLGNRAKMMSVPLFRAGAQELEIAPWGQVTCWLSQSIVNMAVV